MKLWSLSKFIISWLILLSVASCGTTTGYDDLAGGGVGGTGANNDYAGGGIGGTGISVGKIIARGNTSVDVNGVEFDTTKATVTVDGVSGDQNNLKVGMIVKVNGTFNTDRTTGVADNIEYKDILEGPVDTVDTAANSVVVLGQTIIIDSTTYFDDFSDLDGNGIIDVKDIYIGNVIEVSGFVNGDNLIHATYISLKAGSLAGYSSEIELKGRITALNEIPGTFRIGGLTIEFTTATEFEDMGINDLQDGLYVEVKSTAGFSGGMLIASKIELEDSSYHIKDKDEFEIEGYITRVLLTDGQFELAGQLVQVNDDTKYKDGTIVNISDINVNMKLEVEGIVNEFGVLIAHEIKIESGDSHSDDDSDHDSEDSHESDDDESDDEKGDNDPS